MKIRPLNDRILVKRLEGEAKTAGGIIIPDPAQEKPAEGEAVTHDKVTLQHSPARIKSIIRSPQLSNEQGFWACCGAAL